jgi:hypothetical protein
LAEPETPVRQAAPEPEPEPEPLLPPPPPVPAVPRDPLERGRVIKINVGGRMWESVYWTSDEIGPIVAHDTNRQWALMHLDLSRFRDAIEYGEVLNARRLDEIGKSLAHQQQQ